nr:MAG TPA: hypothetical protein [Herelleviridae sp.]
MPTYGKIMLCKLDTFSKAIFIFPPRTAKKCYIFKF